MSVCVPVQEQQLAELGEQLQEQARGREQARAEVEQLRLQAQEAEAGLAQHREAWAGRERELQERLEHQETQLDGERVRRGQRVPHIPGSAPALTRSPKTLTRLGTLKAAYPCS